jgi:hypothetical protein
MATTYGDAILDSARTLISTVLNALKSNMVTNAISPRFAAIYDTHWQTTAPTYPALSIGLGVLEAPTQAAPGSAAGSIEVIAVTVELRILTADDGGPNAYRDEAAICQLVNSAMNWLQERRHLGTQGGYDWHIIGPFRGEMDAEFPYTRSIGGKLTLVIKAWLKYTAA